MQDKSRRVKPSQSLSLSIYFNNIYIKSNILWILQKKGLVLQYIILYSAGEGEKKGAFVEFELPWNEIVGGRDGETLAWH